jgi:pyrroloquinoline quinone (PQQ) biosynthesis protein C
MTLKQAVRAIDELDDILRRSPASWTSGPAEPELVASAAIAGDELARAAYGEGDLSARRRAETLIYRLNLDSCFAPPADPVSGVVWTTLMQAKLVSLRREFTAELAGVELTTGEMQEQLEDAVARWGAFRHPLLDDLEASGALAPYRVWARNWFGSCYGFSLQLASLIQRTTGEAKKAILENLNDEFDDTVTHDVLRVRFYSSLGLHHDPSDAIDDPDWVLDSTELLNLRTALCSLSDPMPALGCFYGVEANWPAECRRHHAMNKRRGLDDETVEYWTTHAFADEHHAAEWLDVVKSTCQTGAQRASVVEGAVIQLRLRWRMYDAIRERVRAAHRVGALVPA